MWHEATKELQAEGKVKMVGIIPEQHPDRTRLFMQWKHMDWPILLDSANLMAVTRVPITLLIDEFGVIRSVRPRLRSWMNFSVTGTKKLPHRLRLRYLTLNSSRRRVSKIPWDPGALMLMPSVCGGSRLR